MYFYTAAWDYSAWVRTYAQFLEERLECFRILGYDIEAERLPGIAQGQDKVHFCCQCLTALFIYGYTRINLWNLWLINTNSLHWSLCLLSIFLQELLNIKFYYILVVWSWRVTNSVVLGHTIWQTDWIWVHRPKPIIVFMPYQYQLGDGCCSLICLQGYSRTRDLSSEELLEQLPALQQLLYRLIGCQVVPDLMTNCLCWHNQPWFMALLPCRKFPVLYFDISNSKLNLPFMIYSLKEWQ